MIENKQQLIYSKRLLNLFLLNIDKYKNLYKKEGYSDDDINLLLQPSITFMNEINDDIKKFEKPKDRKTSKIRENLIEIFKNGYILNSLEISNMLKIHRSYANDLCRQLMSNNLISGEIRHNNKKGKPHTHYKWIGEK